MEFALKLRQLTDILYPALVELNFLIGHNTTDRVANRRIVQTLCHRAQYFQHLLTLVMELVSSGNVRREKQCNRLEQVVDVSESNVDIQAVLLGAVLRREHVLLVGLWIGCCARDLDQFGYFDG